MKKIAINLPAAMIEEAQKPDIAERPFDICLHCPFPGQSCIGPNCQCMKYSRWVTWIKAWIKKAGITRNEIAEKSDHPLSTINYALSGTAKDIKAATMADITLAVIGEPAVRYPCHIAALLMRGELGEEDPEAEALKKQLAEAQSQLLQRNYAAESDHESLAFTKSRIALLDEQIKEKDASIRRKEKVILGLILALIFIALFLVGIIIYDAITPGIGFIRTVAGFIAGGFIK